MGTWLWVRTVIQTWGEASRGVECNHPGYYCDSMWVDPPHTTPDAVPVWILQGQRHRQGYNVTRTLCERLSFADLYLYCVRWHFSWQLSPDLITAQRHRSDSTGPSKRQTLKQCCFNVKLTLFQCLLLARVYLFTIDRVWCLHTCAKMRYDGAQTARPMVRGWVERSRIIVYFQKKSTRLIIHFT